MCFVCVIYVFLEKKTQKKNVLHNCVISKKPKKNPITLEMSDSHDPSLLPRPYLNVFHCG